MRTLLSLAILFGCSQSLFFGTGGGCGGGCSGCSGCSSNCPPPPPPPPPAVCNCAVPPPPPPRPIYTSPPCQQSSPSYSYSQTYIQPIPITKPCTRSDSYVYPPAPPPPPPPPPPSYKVKVDTSAYNEYPTVSASGYRRSEGKKTEKGKKCVNDKLKEIIEANINKESMVQTRVKIAADAKENFGYNFDVICSSGDFNYFISSSFYCETISDGITCLAFQH